MKNLKIGLAILTMASVASLEAQTDMVSDKDGRAEVSTETVTKSYSMNNGKETIKNTVKITSSQHQAIQFSEESEGKVNKNRVLDKKLITKTVEIDNDSDEDFDEKIRFSYRADAPSDFVLVSDSDKFYVALDKGENFEILEEQSFDRAELFKDRDTYVYTDDNGEEVEFFITKYINLDTMKSANSKK